MRSTLAKQVAGSVVENVQRDLEIVGDELSRSHVAPGGITNRAPLCPYAEMANGVLIVVPPACPVRFNGRGERECQ